MIVGEEIREERGCNTAALTEGRRMFDSASLGDAGYYVLGRYEEQARFLQCSA